MSKEWMVQGFSFSSKEEYEKAKKEQESIAYIRANTDFKDIKNAIAVYRSMAEKDMFETVVGYTFMESLRRHIIAKKVVPEEMIPPVHIKRQAADPVSQKKGGKDYKAEYEKLLDKRSISKYLNVALIIIIASMFAITYFSPKNNAEVAQQKVRDEYASWQERLQKQEQELEDREAEITKKEEDLK